MISPKQKFSLIFKHNVLKSGVMHLNYSYYSMHNISGAVFL